MILILLPGGGYALTGMSGLSTSVCQRRVGPSDDLNCLAGFETLLYVCCSRTTFCVLCSLLPATLEQGDDPAGLREEVLTVVS